MRKYILIITCLILKTIVHAQITSTAFAANVNFGTGTGATSQPSRQASADLDGDGKIDMIVPNISGNSISVFRNISTGTGFYSSSFAAKVDYTMNTGINGVALADVDGDGKPDLITSHTGGTSIYVYRNVSSVGTITFAIGNAFTCGNVPSCVATGDIDGDGKLDIVTANQGGAGGTSLSVLRNTSTGAGTISFATTVNYTTSLNTAYFVKLADFDGDAKLDVAVSNYVNPGSIAVYRNTSTSGSISLTSSGTFTAGNLSGCSDVGDIDGDGKKDIAVSNYGGANVSVLRNTSTGIGSISFATQVTFTTGTNPQGISLSDLDGDGKPDMELVNRGSGTLSVFRNTAIRNAITAGSFAARLDFTLNANPTFINLADLDADGKLDITATNNGSGNFSVLRNQIIAAEPTTAASNLTFSNISSTSMTLTWTNGNGSKRLVLIKAGSAVNADPADSFGYTANPALGNGSQIGTGNYAVYNDTNNTVTVTGLTSGTTYYFRVIEYNGSGPYSNYLTSSTLNGSQVATSLVFYNKSTGALNLLSTWGTNSDGTGTAPSSFSGSNAIYFVVNNSSPSISASWTITGTNSLVVFGDAVNAFNLAIPTGLMITADTISVRNGVTLTIQGTLSVNRSYFEDGSTAQYLGASGQSIAPANYYVLIAASGSKVLSGNVTVRNLLNMSTNINEGAYLITLGTGISQTGTLNRTAGTIIGNFTRWFSNTTNSGATGLFPIGTLTYYRPIQIEYTSAPTAGGTLTASYLNSDPGSTGLPLYDFTIPQSMFIDQQSVDGYWHIAVNGVIGGTYSSTATATAIGYVSSYADLRMLRRNNSSSAWTLPGTAVLGSGSNAVPVVKRTGLTANGGDFGVGSDHTLNALPVKLIILTVYQNNTEAMLSWATASEENSDYFEIERSNDNNDWRVIGKVKAAGNTNEINSYQYPDDIKSVLQQNAKTIYYRLKQVDQDGTEISSNTITLTLKGKVSTITLYPLPINNILNAVSNNAENITGVVIQDMSGKELMKSATSQMDVTPLAQGIYIVKVTTDRQSYYQKITK